MARMKPIKPGKKPDYRDFLEKSKKYMSNPDRKDYARTIAGRGDTHALDGGKIPASKTKRGKKFLKAKDSIRGRMNPAQPLLPIWEDRDVKKRGSKLGG